MKNNNIYTKIQKILEPLLFQNFIFVPDWAKKVKIDIGLSYNAPHSEFWTENDPEVCVFGFEPNIYNIEHLYTGIKINPNQLNPEKIGKSFFLTNCAVSNYFSDSETFYCTKEDPGTSSLFIPKYLEVKKITKVPVITLEVFFDLFPWHKFDYIEHLKIDTQSSDFNVIIGAGKYLKEKILYIDVETTTNGHYLTEESPEKLRSYLESQGFECLVWGENATFYNTRFNHVKNKIKYSIL